MGKVRVLVVVFLCLMLVITGCSKAPGTSDDNNSEGQTAEQNGGDAVLGESKDVLDGHGPIGDPDPETVTRERINENVKGYRTKELHLSYIESGDTYSVELSFVGLTEVERMTEESSGKAHYYSVDNSFGMAYYTADFEESHELYNYRFDVETWEIVEYLSAKYVDGASVAYEPSLTEEEYIQMCKDVFEIMKKESSRHGEKIA